MAFPLCSTQALPMQPRHATQCTDVLEHKQARPTQPVAAAVAVDHGARTCWTLRAFELPAAEGCGPRRPHACTDMRDTLRRWMLEKRTGERQTAFTGARVARQTRTRRRSEARRGESFAKSAWGRVAGVRACGPADVDGGFPMATVQRSLR